MKKSDSTRERIVNCAVTLFNTHGAHSITTNHIAEELGMSPGNLYYHFRNKQEIIREIFAAITVRFRDVWSFSSAAISADDLTALYDSISDIYFCYRFFYLELPTLIAQDDLLKKQYISNQQTKYTQIESLISGFVASGVMNPPCDERELRSWVENSWIINDFRLSYLCISGSRITREGVRDGVLNFFYFIKPLLTKKGLGLFSF
jgi:AcrR family transcriptional regulator